MGLFDQSQGLMGLGQQPQQGQPQGNMSQFEIGVPPPLPDGYLDYTSSFGRQFGLGGNDTPSALTPQQWMANKPSAYNSGDTSSFNPPNYMGQQPQGDSFMGGNPFTQTGYAGVKPTGMGGFYAEETGFTPPQDYVSYLGGQDLINKQNSMPYQSQDNLFGQQGSSQGAMFRQEPTDPNYVQRNYTAQDVQTAMKNPEFDSNYYKFANVLDAQGNPLSMDAKQQLIQPFYNQQQQPNPAMQAPQTMQPQQPPQFFQPQPMQPSNPVNTQTVQPNFMGQTPFGQPQTGQFTSTNPFVQAAQANAQGNIAGALQATAANRINQQTPYGSLQYQQTGTDAQGNPIWSANQQLSPELQQLTQSSLAGLQASQANPMYGINPGDTYSNAIMQRLAPQQSQAREALDAQLANQGIMPGSEAYNRAKVLQGQTQNDALTSAIVGGMQTGLQAQGLQNTTAANIRNLATPGYVTPYNQATVAGPDYLSAYTSQNATDIARQNAEAAQRSSLLSGLAGLGSSAILGGTGANSALGGLLGLGSKGLEALGNTSLWNSLFGGTGPAITGDQDFLKSIGLAGSTYGSDISGMATDPLAGLFTGSQYPFAGYEDFLGF